MGETGYRAVVAALRGSPFTILRKPYLAMFRTWLEQAPNDISTHPLAQLLLAKSFSGRGHAVPLRSCLTTRSRRAEAVQHPARGRD